MKVLLQRVSRGAVRIEGEIVGAVARGFVILFGARPGDTPADAEALARKVAALRVFPDAADKMNLALTDVDGGALVISQFTLYADTRKGNRPGFIGAAPPELARGLYDHFVAALRALLGPARVATGRFGATMQVEIVNEGPVTIMLEAGSE